MMLWFGVLAAVLATYGMKVSLIALGDRVRIPDAVDRASAFTAPAVMTALAVRSLMQLRHGEGAALPLVLGVVAGALAAARTRSIPWTVGTGLAAAAIAEHLIAS
jgi:branched-subunit amino acid transport protein